MELEKVKSLLREAVQLGLTEFSFEEGESKVSFKIGHEPATVVQRDFLPLNAEKKEERAIIHQEEKKREEKKRDDADFLFISSPMVGTFYVSPDPESPPFATKGKAVKKGDVVCIVEAMKVMNEVKSDVCGVVEEVFIENGQPVEFGTKLFSVRPE